jgi:GNAT superfamily N-acetyltransferase
VVDAIPGEGSAPTPDAVLATKADLDALAGTLSDAFFDDPVMAWLLKDEESRRRRLVGLFSTQLKAHYFSHGAVWTSPDRSAAALWSPPGHAIMHPLTVLAYSPDLVRALGRNTLRAIRTLNHVERQHPKDPHWYLGVLGTRTASQGKGLGSAALGPVLRRCDREGIPAYLESSKFSNLAFYRRHGFEVTGEIALPFGGPSVWPMWRDPRTP